MSDSFACEVFGHVTVSAARQRGHLCAHTKTPRPWAEDVAKRDLQHAQHGAGLFAGRGGVRLEAAVRHAADDAGAVQRLHGGQRMVGNGALVREGGVTVCSLSVTSYRCA